MTLDHVCIVRNYIPTTEKTMAGSSGGIWSVGIRACAGYELADLYVIFAPTINWHRVELLGDPLCKLVKFVSF